MLCCLQQGCACICVGILLCFCADEGRDFNLRASSVLLRLDLATALKPLKLRLSLAKALNLQLTCIKVPSAFGLGCKAVPCASVMSESVIQTVAATQQGVGHEEEEGANRDEPCPRGPRLRPLACGGVQVEGKP
jgi:hypothetical protein